MIIECKICKGTGRGSSSPLSFGVAQVCPACKGAGELEVNIPILRSVTCKYCEGKGQVLSGNLLSPNAFGVCPACKGVGVLERPVVGQTVSEENSITNPQTPRLRHYDYDIAVSFANEDREIVERYCETIAPRAKELKIFYDKYEQVNLWGANLYDKLDEVYRTKALCCVIFISKHYAEKVWTNHERKAAQARALQENIEYVLPVRLDDTEIPGIPPTVGYLDLRKISVGELAYRTIEKVKELKSRRS